jgi:Concanavalin A-like lectin/glucanases superfamily
MVMSDILRGINKFRIAHGVLVVLCCLSGPAGAQTCVQPPPGLVSWWPGDGNADDVQNVNDGTLQGGATFAAGVVGQAFSFNGANAFVQAPENGSLDFNGPFTIDLWVNPNGSTPEGPLVSKYDFSGSNFLNTAYEVSLWSAGVLQFGITCGNTTMLRRTVPNVLPPDVFSHVALVYSTDPSPALEIYVNGVAQPGTTGGACTFINQNNIPFRIGKRIGAVEGERFFHGLIDEVDVFNRALSASEIQAIYTAGGAGKCKPPTLDHFQCYEAKGEGPKVYVDLEDQFGAATTSVGKPEFFCNPVDKNGEGITNPAIYLTCYNINGESAKQNVSVENQFGRQTLDLRKPGLLCVPSNKTER